MVFELYDREGFYMAPPLSGAKITPGQLRNHDKQMMKEIAAMAQAPKEFHVKVDTSGVDKLNEAAGKINDLAKSLEGDERQGKALDALECVQGAAKHLTVPK